jgi:hypothetical protein
MMLIDKVDIGLVLQTERGPDIPLRDLLSGPLVIIFLRHLA